MLPEIDRRIKRTAVLKGTPGVSYIIAGGKLRFKFTGRRKFKAVPESNELSPEAVETLKAQLDVIKKSAVIPKDALSKIFM